MVVKPFNPSWLIALSALLWFLLHEAATSVATPPGWDASPLQVSPQHSVRLPQ